ncbi:hypothetical protein OROHE_014009 [Orobanche hederae]
MAFNAHDIQVCLSQILKLFSETCITYSLKHPILSFSILCLFLLYISFPLVFWVLVYSFPLVVCTSVILSLSFNIGNVKKHKDAPHDYADEKRTFARVHSVRRRRAKEIREVEDKNAVSSTNFNQNMVDKNTLIEENSPKEIREVVDCSRVNSTKSSSYSTSQSSKQDGFNESGDLSSKDGYIIIINKATQGNEEDDYQKNKMDVGISDMERNKRLESLIARRRSRKLLNVEVRRALMSKDRNDHKISSIVIPENNNTSRLLIPSNSAIGGSPISPSPGSAPSVLIPMRNPFDIPYDPQEEKPDLTGDSFEQEFTSGSNSKDMMFCRHESFSLGSFLPGEHNQDLKEASSSVHVSRFSLRTSSSLGYQFDAKPAVFGCDRENTSIMEHDPYEPSESKPTTASPQDDHIKEIIQAHENSIRNDDIDEVLQRRPTPEDDTSRSPTSSEEDAPVFKIDREAILKSLSSIARRNTLQEETENNNNSNINNEQIGEELNRLKDRFCYTGKTTGRHTVSYSIASDLQVEVSEVSSPPLTIDENLSYLDYYDEDNNSTYDEYSWAGESHFDLSQVDDYKKGSVQVGEVSNQDTALSDEQNCDHPWCVIAEFPDSCQTNRATTLDEKIDKTLQRSLSLLDHTSEELSHEFNKSDKNLNTLDAINRSKTVLDNNTNQIKESETIELNTDDQQVEQLHECHDMEQPAATSTNSYDDSEERLEVEHLEMIMSLAVVEDQISLESAQQGQGEQGTSAEASITLVALGSNVHVGQSNLIPYAAFEHVPSSLPSPKSVLHQTCSVASFDHYVDDEVHQFNAHTAQVSSPIARQNSTAFTEHSAALPSCSREESKDFEESPQLSKTSTTEADTVSVEPEEDTCASLKVPSFHEASTQPTEETSYTSFNIDDEAHSNNLLTAFNDSNHALSTQQELPNRQETVIGESTEDDTNVSSSDEGRTENSILQHEHNLDNPKDQERRANSRSKCFDETQDEVLNSGTNEAPILELLGQLQDKF